MTSATPKPRAGEHTKGPWRSGNGEDYNARQVFIRASEYDDHICVVDTEANARRIVACVNACEGIENEWLEVNAGMLQGHDHALERERDALRELATRLDKLSRSADAFDLSTKNGRAALANEIYVLGSTARVLIAKVQS